MTKRLETMVAVASILTWTVSSEAQSRVASQREAFAEAYMNSETGLTLAQAIERALTQEPTLGPSRTAVDVALGELLQGGLRPNPSVSFMQQNQPGGTDSQTRVELQWPLDLFRKSGRVQVAEQELHAAQHGVSDRERALVIDVRMKYGEVVAAIRDLSVNDDLVATMTRQAE